MSERGTQTSQLRNVIQVLQLGNKSGILTVTHQSTVIVEGWISFIQGSITDSRLYNLSGQQALNVLLGWDACRFSFATVEVNTDPQHHSVAVSPITDPLLHAMPLSRPLRPKQDPPPFTPRSVRPLASNGGERVSSRRSSYTPPSPIIPKRIRHDAESFQRLAYADLSRLHTRLFLLIDGERSVHDLARLLNHSPQEVQKLLFDLEKSGVIIL